MSEVISKELLSEVMPKWIIIESSGKYTDEYGFDAIEFTSSFNDALGGKSLSSEKINIHELAHKCKEWAYDSGYRVEESAYEFIVYAPGESLPHSFKTNLDKKFDPERCFMSCQWILENK